MSRYKGYDSKSREYFYTILSVVGGLIALTIYGVTLWSATTGLSKEVTPTPARILENIYEYENGFGLNNNIPANNSRIIDIEIIGEQIKEFYLDEINANNCLTNSPWTYSSNVNGTRTSEIQLGGSFSIGIEALIKAGIEAGIHITEGEDLTRGKEIVISADPQTHKRHPIIWEETWVTGYVTLYDESEDKNYTVPFEANTQLNPRPLAAENIGCD